MPAKTESNANDLLSPPQPLVLERRVGGLATLDRFLVGIGVIRATAVLTGIAVVASLILTVAIEFLLFSQMRPSDLIVAALVATLVSAPICAYAQTLIRNIRAKRHALKQLTERLALALERAEDANHAKSQFLANMSHELRTPLNAIIGFSEMMRTQLLGPIGNARYLDYAKDIHSSGEHLLNIINDILDLARIEAGQTSVPEVAECDIEAIIDATLRMIRPIAEKRRVTVRREPACASPRLLGGERMIRQVLTNILSNAIKFTPSGGHVAIAQSMTEAGDYVLSVTDSGVGMSPAQIVVALTPFGQNDNHVDHVNKGTGLGLPLAKAMMEMHGGCLSIDSSPGRGTTVGLNFPADCMVRPTTALTA